MSQDHAKRVPPDPTYDLTTISGFAKATEDYVRKNPEKALLYVLAPGLYLYPKAGKAMAEAFGNLFKDSEKVIAAQRQAAIDIIKSGKENGAKKVKVVLDQNAGLDIGADLQGFDVKFNVGSDSKMTLEVEY